MPDSHAQTATNRAAFEALRERWRQAQANGTAEAFARELGEQGTRIAPSTDTVYASEAERAAYEWSRTHFEFRAADLRELLPYYFGEIAGIPADDALAQLEATTSGNGMAGGEDGPAP